MGIKLALAHVLLLKQVSALDCALPSRSSYRSKHSIICVGHELYKLTHSNASFGFLLALDIMELHFTRPGILNTVLRDAQGTPVYRIETDGSTLQLAERTTTISRFLNVPAPGSAERVLADNMSDTDILLNALEEQPIGQIVWRRLKQSTLKFGEKEVKVNDFMPLSKTHAK